MLRGHRSQLGHRPGCAVFVLQSSHNIVAAAFTLDIATGNMVHYAKLATPIFR
jgi:hypothetical protein